MKSKIKRMLGILLAFCMMLGMMPMNASAEEAVPTYTVTFDSNGGSAVAAQSVQEGQTATEPAAPTKAGYTFMGWTRKGSPYDFSKPVTGNITLYARWGTTYNVSAIPALDSGDSLVDDDLDSYFPASSSYKYLQNTPYWKWYDPSIPNGIAVSGVNYYAYTIMYLEDYSAVPYEGDFVVKYAGTELSKLSSTEIYEDNMKSGYRIYMFDTYNVALQVRIFVGAPIGTGATYNITSGANSVYQKGSAVDKLTFTADGDSSDFLGVEVDGSLIDVGKYDTEVGGTTIIKLRKAYLESLSVGEHTLRIRYHDGAAPTKFTVVDEEPVPADYAIEVSLNGYSLGAKVADAYVSESSDTVDFYDFNDDGTFFCIFEDDGTGQSDWGSTVTEFEADKDYWLVVALTKQGGGALPETGLDADNATLRNGCVDKYSVYDDDLWWIEFKLNRLSESLSGVYNITFDANGGSVTPESATTGSDGKLTDLPIPTHTSPSMAFDGWYTGKTGDIKVTTDTVFTSDTTIYAHWNVDYTIEVTLNGYELGKKVADTTLVENSDSLDLDLENCHIFTDEDGEPDWSSEVTEFEAGVEYWLVVALTKQGGEELTSVDLSADDVDLTNDHTAELMDYDDDLWWVSYKLKPLEDTTPTFDIWVGGVGMNDGDYLHEGASAVSSAAPTDSSVGYAYYNDGVLTLHNYDYSGAPALDIDGSTDYYAVYRDGDLKVVLDGENSLTLTEVTMNNSAGILVEDLTVEEGSGGGSLTISGAGFGMIGDTVTINSGTFDIDVHYAAILAMMNITIENGEYDLTAESWGCIYSYDGMVTIENGEFVLASENGAGMYSDGSIHIKNGTFEIDADTGIASVDILIEDGTLTIDAECGMDVYSEEDQPTSITIKGGNLNVTAQEDGLCAWEGSIDIQGGEMEIKSTDTENDEAYAAFYADSITIADTLSVLASTVPEGSDPEVYDKTQNSTYDWVKTGPIVQTTYTATVEHGTGAGEYAAGETVTIEAEELDGKLFREWTSQDGVTFADSKSAATTFTMLGKDVTVTATYDTIVTVIDISGITPPVVGATPNDSFVVSTPGVELGAEIFWSRYDEATNKLIQTYEDDKLVNNELFRAGYYVKLQTEVWAMEGYVFTPDTIIRYNGVELPVMDNTDLKPNFRYPILDARRYRTAASIGWEVVEAEPVTIEIPVTKVVKKGGNTDFSGRETFRFAVEVLNSNVDAGALSIIGDTMIVTDKNGQETVITITVPGEMFADVIDEGFLITEIKGTAQGWTYDETQWIAVYDEETGWKFVPYDELFGDVEPEFQDEVTFTNIYTKNVEEPKQEESKPSAPAVNPQAPQTGDNSPVALWSSMMVISVLCAAVVVFGKKRFSVK